MDDATRMLRREHEALRKMLLSAKEAAERVHRGEHVPHKALARAVEFFQEFMEGCLLTKEEDFLVAALERKGLSRHSKPISLTLIRHERGRQLIREMAEASAACEGGSKEAPMKWADLVSDFAALMLDHLKEEDANLFMMADSFLQPNEQADLAARFERLDAAKAISGRHQQAHAIAEDLLREGGTLRLAG